MCNFYSKLNTLYYRKNLKIENARRFFFVYNSVSYDIVKCFFYHIPCARRTLVLINCPLLSFKFIFYFPRPWKNMLLLIPVSWLFTENYKEILFSNDLFCCKNTFHFKYCVLMGDPIVEIELSITTVVAFLYSNFLCLRYKLYHY